MAKTKRQSSTATANVAAIGPVFSHPMPPAALEPEVPLSTAPVIQSPQSGGPTGRFIVTFREGTTKETMAALKRAAGIKDVASTADFKGGAVAVEEVVRFCKGERLENVVTPDMLATMT